uniref:G-protein coupled receptors family 1 profile domain-containing protein n=1 Tax=Acrobeloides nanus TaxID=290746 RepID=A0A914CQI5_9BILA
MERYLVVCTKWRYTISRACTTLVPLSIGVIFSVIIPAIPPIVFTSTHTHKDETNSTITLCLDEYPESYYPIFAHYTFIFGFAMPLTVMGICYYSLVQHVRQKFQQRYEHKFNLTMPNPVQRPRYIYELTRSIWRIAIFHFTCWAPYWFFILVPVFVQTFQLPFQVNDSEWFKTGDLFARILPLINSAGNWIFYAFLNQEVRKHLYYRRRNKREVCESFTYTIHYFPSRVR